MSYAPRARDLTPTICAAVVALTACVACGGSERRADAASPHIVFYSARDGDPEIYTMKADGSEPMRMTFHSAADTDPDVSPDRERIVFTSNREGNEDIFVVGIGGGEPLNLTKTPSMEGWARWSPDGRRIAFHSNRDGNLEIYTMNADGSAVTRVTQYAGDDKFPDWSPDGAQLLFLRDHDVWVANVDGSDPRALTNSPGLDQMAVQSPDGELIAFMSLREGYCAVFVMHADGSDQKNVTPKDAADANDQWCSRMPSWSRDGRIYLTSKRPSTNGDPEIFVMNADGTGITRLTTTPGLDGSPRSY